MTCLDSHTSNEDLELLRLEKESNVAGMIAGIQKKKVLGLSVASLGKQLGERILCEKILSTESSVRQITEKAAMPFGISWDFYGVVR